MYIIETVFAVNLDIPMFSTKQLKKQMFHAKWSLKTMSSVWIQ